MTHRYIALYDENYLLTSMVLYKVNSNDDILPSIDVYAYPNEINKLIKKLKNLMPFEPFNRNHIIDVLKELYSNNYNMLKDIPLATDIKNITVAKNRVIQQENPKLIRKRVNIYDD